MDNKITYNRDSTPPVIKNNFSTLNCVKSLNELDSSNDGKEQIELPSGSVEPGKIAPGSPVKFKCGNWCVKKTSEHKWGAVNIYMFVFESLEMAEKVIGRYNSLTEEQQLAFWKGIE